MATRTVIERLPAPIFASLVIVALLTAALLALFVLWLLAVRRARKLSRAGQELAFDELTGVLRRVGGMAAVEREIARSRRYNTPLSVSFIDVDGLKVVNDTKGHAAGDKLLQGVATHLQEHLRRNDLVFRFGGDEFVCVLPDADQVTCERLFRRLRANAFSRGCQFTYGVASLRNSDDASTLLARADAALYETRARERGDEEPTLYRVKLEPAPGTDA